MSEKTEDFSESGEAIARAVHRLRDVGAGTDENVDVRSEVHNGVEIRLTDDNERTTNFESSKSKSQDEEDWVMKDLREQFRKLENDE